MKANPIDKRATPAYGLEQLTNIRPITAPIGTKFPKQLAPFLRIVRLSFVLVSRISAKLLLKIVIIPKHKYGTADKIPFCRFSISS